MCGVWHNSFVRWPRAGFDLHKMKTAAFLLLAVSPLWSRTGKSWSLDSVPNTAAVAFSGTGWRKMLLIIMGTPLPGWHTQQTPWVFWTKTQGQWVKYCVLHGCGQAQKMETFVFTGKLLCLNCLFPQQNLFFQCRGLIYIYDFISGLLHSNPFKEQDDSIPEGTLPE